MSILATDAIEPGNGPVATLPGAPTRVLVIDDEEIVANTLKALLEADGYEVVAALGGLEGVQALRKQPFDVAIVDLVMAGMDGIRTISALKAVLPGIEVIMLTGHATVNSTIAALREGACDFLLKPIGLDQLRPAIKRTLQKHPSRSAIRAAEACGELRGRLKGEDSIPAVGEPLPEHPPAADLNKEDRIQDARSPDESAAKLQAIFDGVETGIFLIDPATHQIVDANPLALKLVGAKRKDVLGAVCHKFVCPADRGRCPFTDLNQKVDNSERVLLTAEGERIPIIKTVRRVDIGGRTLLLESFFDISARKQAETALRESEDRYRDLVENSFVLISTHDTTGRFLSLNRATARVLEVDKAEEVIGRSLRDYVPQSLKPKFDEYLQTILRDGHAEGLMVITTPSGNNKIVEYQNTLRRQDPHEPIIRCIGQDVSERFESERVQAFLASCVESSQDAIIGVSPEGSIVSWNRGAQELYGYTPSEVKGKPISILAPPDRREELGHLLENSRQGQRISGHETVRVGKGGRRLEVSLTISPILNKDGKVMGSTSIGRDITERKRAEAAVTERHRLAAMVAEVGLALTASESLWDGLQHCADILVRNIGAAFARIWTLNEAEKVLELQASAGMYIHLDGNHARIPLGKFKIGRIAESGEPHLTNQVQTDPWVGDPEWARREGMVAFAGYPLKIEDRVLGVVAAFARHPLNDATLQALASMADNISQFIRRKRAEIALRESEQRYRMLFEHNLAGVFRGNFRTRTLLDCNDAYARIFGYGSRQEVFSEGGRLHDFCDPAEAEKARDRLVKERALTNFEARFLRHDGTAVWVLLNVTLSTLLGGAEPLIEGTLFDITERKLAEQALAEERDLLRSLMDNIPDYIYFKDHRSRFVRANSAHARTFGFDDPAALLGKTDFDFFTSEHAQQAFDDEQRVIRTGIPIVAKEEKETWPDGRVSWVSTTKVALRDSSGEIVGTFGVSRNITERKRAEEELLLKTALLEAIAETTIDGILVVDDAGHVLTVNRRFAELWNLPADLVSTNDDKKFLEYVVSQMKDPGAFLERVKYLYTHDTEKTREQIELGDGRVFDRYSSPLHHARGKKYGRIWYFRDITENKRAEAALRESESRFRRLIESNLFGIFVGTGDGCIKEANAAFLQMLGYTEEDLRAGLVRWDRMTPPDFQYVNGRIFQQLHASGVSTPMEVEYLRKDGSRVPVMIGLLTLDASGNKAIAFVIDLTQRKEAEEKVKESNELVNLLLDSIPEAVYGIDLEGKCTFCNPACLHLLGYEYGEAGDVLGKNMHALIHHTRQDGTPYPVEECHIYEAFRRGHGTHIDNEVLWRRDGSSYPAEYWSRPIYRNGNAIGTVVTFIDITERRQAEHQSRIQTAALESAANGIAITDHDGHILWVNPAFTYLTGYEEEEVLAKTPHILSSGVQDAAFYEGLWQTILGGKVWQGELVNRRKDGTLYTDFTTITPVRDASGELTHFVAIKQDVTERRRAERALEERTAYLNTLFEISPMGIVVLDMDDQITMSNSVFERLFGYSREEITGGRLDDFIIPPELATEAKMLTGLCLSGPGANFTTFRRRKDGSLVDVDIYGVPLVIEGELCGVLALYQDITERKRAEAELVKYAEDLEISKATQEEHATELAQLVEELAQERDLLGTLMDTLPDYVYLKDCQGRFLRVNPATARTLGISDPRQAVGKTAFDFFPQDDASSYSRDERQVIEAGRPLISQMEKTRQPDGKYRWISTSKVPIRDTQGRVTSLVGIGRDMTEHMQTEEKIRESEAKYRSLVSNVPDVIWTADSDLQFAFISPNIERVTGYSLAEFYRCGAALLLENMHGEDVGRVSKSLEALFVKGEPYDVECRVRRKDGEWRWVHDRAVATYLKDGVRYADGLLSDITASKRAEETLRASEERYRELFENASDIVYTTGLDMRLTSLNRVGQRVLGYSAEEAVNLDLRQLVVDKHWEKISASRARLMAGDMDITIEVEVTTKDGRPMTLEVKPRLIYRGGKPVGVQGIGRDITGRDEAEMELRHAQKLESVGRLASGIAHEINTPIQFVGDNTRFLQDSFGCLQTLINQYHELRDVAAAGPVSPELIGKVRKVEYESDSTYLMDEIPKALTQTLDGVTRVATIVRAMKEFAHPEGKEMAAADLNRAILSTLTVARNELKYVADVETEFGELPMVVCNIGDLNQVFLNLLVNAAHAIGEVVEGTANKGKICLRTVAEGDTVLVTISDTGCGIPEANRARVFDPFFTTKEVGRGTGQGLAIARSVVVDRHKGSLTFESELGKGTVFHVRLPIDPGDCSKEAKGI